MSHSITTILQTSGYVGIFIAMVLESACIPIPSELIMAFGGYLVFLGHLNFWGVVVCGTLGNLVGSLVAYYVGRSGGRLLILKYGRVIHLSERHLQSAENWFAKRGQASVLIARVLPIVRTFISLPAGIAKMPVGRFAWYTLIGTLPWVYMLTWAGTDLGHGWQGINRYMHPFTDIMAGVLVIFVLALTVRIIRRRRSN